MVLNILTLRSFRVLQVVRDASTSVPDASELNTELEALRAQVRQFRAPFSLQVQPSVQINLREPEGVGSDARELEDELASRETELTGKDSRIATLEEEVAALTARLASEAAVQVGAPVVLQLGAQAPEQPSSASDKDRRIQELEDRVSLLIREHRHANETTDMLREDAYHTNTTIEQIQSAYITTLAKTVYLSAKEGALDELRWMAANNDAGTIDRLQEDVAALRADIRQLRARPSIQINSGEPEDAGLDARELEDELESRETELTGKDRRIATLEEEVAALTARLASEAVTQADVRVVSELGSQPSLGSAQTSDVSAEVVALQQGYATAQAEITRLTCALDAKETVSLSTLFRLDLNHAPSFFYMVLNILT